ncbi:MAG: hypothetical protein HOD92_01485 [Deltaproteobacteria bacterium]|jgi:hypothetical protein|nr:hypothetical protein [Deltaproteobacteria bacterium]MBT4525695.1 hypothetical protein [Deltaproteobacteria bacterium]
MTEIHNLQIVIMQSSKHNRMLEGMLNGATNGAQIINVVAKDNRELKRSSVQQVSKSEISSHVEREDKRKKKSAGQQKEGHPSIDLFG